MPVYKILIFGEAWGKDEAELERPFVGATGRELNRLLEETGFIPSGTANELARLYFTAKSKGERLYAMHRRDEIFRASGIVLGNVFNLQPPGNRIEDLCGPRWGDLPAIKAGKYLRPEFLTHLENLKALIACSKPNLLFGLGATSVWFALGTAQIAKRRGTVAYSDYGKFIATYHPAFLMRGAWELRPTVVLDFLKAKRECEFPELSRPARCVYIPETIEDIEYCLRDIELASLISIDIETVGDQITCIGFAWSRSTVMTIPITDFRRDSCSYWSEREEPIVWQLIKRLCALPIPKVFQNGLYDIHFLWKQYGIAVANCKHDTMLLHHALQPEVQKGLGFLGSVYTDEPAWKLMRPRGKGTIKREDE